MLVDTPVLTIRTTPMTATNMTTVGSGGGRPQAAVAMAIISIVSMTIGVEHFYTTR